MKKSILFAGIGWPCHCHRGCRAADTPRYDAREHNQRARIHNGVANGELTRARDAPARGRPGASASRRARAEADGVVTGRERAQLQHEANQQSRRIYRQKHDAQDRELNRRNRDAERARLATVVPFSFHGPGAAGLIPGAARDRVSCAPHDATLRSWQDCCFAASARAQTPRSRARSRCKPCRLEHPARMLALPAECGTFAVPENPDEPERSQDRSVRRARAGHQPQQGAGSAVPHRGRSRHFGGGSVHLVGRAIRSRAPRSRHHAAGSARHRPFAPPRLRVRRPESVSAHRRNRSRRREHQVPRRTGEEIRSALVHHQHRGPGSRRGAARARIRAHQSLRRLLRHTRRAALRAPLSEVHAHADSRRRRESGGRAGTGDRDRRRAGARTHPGALHGRCLLRKGVHRSVRRLSKPARATPAQARARTDGQRRRHGPAHPLRIHRAASVGRAALRELQRRPGRAAAVVTAPGGARRQLHAARQPVPRVRAFARRGFRLRHAQQRGLQRRRAAHRRGQARPRRAQCHAHGRRAGAAAGRGLPRLAEGRGRRGPARAVQEQGGRAAAVGRGRSGHAARIRDDRAARLRRQQTRDHCRPWPRPARRALRGSHDGELRDRRHGAKDLDASCTEKLPPMPFFTTLAGPAP